MDTLCKKEMMLRPPVPDFAFGIKGDCGNVSVPHTYLSYSLTIQDISVGAIRIWCRQVAMLS